MINPSIRRVSVATLALAAAILSGCAELRVGSFIERGMNLNRYHTYNWSPDDQLLTGDPRLDNNSFFLERLQTDVDTRLAAKGFERTTSAVPDLLLHYHASIWQQLDASALDQKKYGLCADCQPSLYDAGTLLLDFVDARTNKLVWRGWAEGGLDNAIDNQERMEKRIDQAVTKILQRLPRL